MFHLSTHALIMGHEGEKGVAPRRDTIYPVGKGRLPTEEIVQTEKD